MRAMTLNVENFHIHSYFLQAFAFRKSRNFKGFEITVIILTSNIRLLNLLMQDILLIRGVFVSFIGFYVVFFS